VAPAPYIPPPAPTVPVAAPSTPAAPVTAPERPSPLAQTGRPATTLTEADAVRRDLAEIEARRGSTLGAGLNFRSRNGDDGRSKLTEFEAPVEARIGLGYDQHLVLKAAGVSVDAVRLDNSDRGANARFGTNALGTAANFTNNTQNDSGLALGLGYDSQWLKADIGTTPIGFRLRNTIGGLRVQGPTGNNLKFFGDLSRRAVTDSVLSYAGTIDDRTGREWGGVVSTGGRVGMLYDDGYFGSYVSGSYHRLTGDEVLDNKRGGVGGGFFVRLIDVPVSRLTVGADLTYFRYQKNLRYFSLGHGGYFSPQRYVSATVPVDWLARQGGLIYNVRGFAGIQSFRENDTPWFPTNDALQAQLNGLAAVTPGLQSQYSGQTKTGGIYGLQLAVEYQVAPQFFVGGAIGFENARDYRQGIGGVFVHYHFSRVPDNALFTPRWLRFNTTQF
jgi:hypothetical protein